MVLEVPSGRVVADGLCMPHSPRWYKNQLWVLNSGTGELLLVNTQDGRRQAVCRLPGYLRGLTFVGPYALIGMSRIRQRHIFGGLPLQQSGEALQCGVAVVDVRSGQRVAMFEFTSGCTELYDVQYLPRWRRPMILNQHQTAVQEALTDPESSFWLRPSKLVRDESASSEGTNHPDASGSQEPLATSAGA